MNRKMTSVCPRVKTEQLHAVAHFAGKTKACGVCASGGKNIAQQAMTVRIIL